MNAKQSLKLCRQQLLDIEATLARASRDIKRYNECIDSMIQGGSPCDWCEDARECGRVEKAEGKGCDMWWLAYEEEEQDGRDKSIDG